MKIKIGSKAPLFSLPDQSGQIVNLSEFIGKKNIVVFFYPKDDTPGCTKEACSFRDHYDQFTGANAEVLGISSDSVQSHSGFADRYQLPFKILSDVNGETRILYDVPKSFIGLFPGRVTYIIDKNGVIRHIFNSQLNSEKHISEALRILKQLN